MIKRICEDHAKSSIKTTSKVNTHKKRHQHNYNACIEQDSPTSKGCINAAHKEDLTQDITSTSVANDTYGAACRGALCVLRKRTIELQNLILIFQDSNCRGKLVLVHLP